MRRGKPNALQTVDFMDGFKQLDEGRCAGFFANLTFAITGDDLAEQGDFFGSARNQFATLNDNIVDGPASLSAARVWNNTKSAILVTPLHDADVGGDGFLAIPVQEVLLNRGLAARFILDIDDFVALAREDVVEVIDCPVEFLRADNQIDVGQAVDQFPAAALGHATEEAKDHVRPAAAHLRRDIFHFAKGLLFGGVAHAARIEPDDFRSRLGSGESVALGDELSGDLFRVALIHLATVSFDIDTRHRAKRSRKLRYQAGFGKEEDVGCGWLMVGS